MPYPLYSHTLLSDFNGANESPISEGGKWDAVSGYPTTAARTSNRMTGSTSNFWAARYTTEQLGNFELTIPCPVANSGGGNFTLDIVIRCLSEANGIPALTDRKGYVILWNSAGEGSISRANAGDDTLSELAFNSGTVADDNDVFGVQAIDDSIKLFFQNEGSGDFTELLTATDDDFASGWLQIGGFGVGTDTAFDSITLGLPQGDSVREVQVRHSRGVSW